MNNKESEAYRLLDISIQCCSTTNKDGSSSINKEDVLGKNRTENVIMTRCVFINLLLHSGYSYSTIANILNKTIPAIRHLVKVSNSFFKLSRAYRIAIKEAYNQINKNKEEENSK